MVQHYMAIITPRPEGGWHAILTDFPGISADAARIDAAKNELARVVGDSKIEAVLFQPMTLTDFRASRGKDIDWRGAVISMMPLPIPDMRQQPEDLISFPESFIPAQAQTKSAGAIDPPSSKRSADKFH